MDATTALVLLGATAASSAAAMYNNRQNIKYASEANAESVNLANTAHQREIRDLEAAGLNPILSSSSSGSASPILKTPGLESIDGGVSSNAGSLARSLNGITKAEVENAKADASTAKAYAKQADALASIEREQAQVDLDLARIDADARIDALEGTVTPQHYIGSDGVYDDLVKKYRNEIKSGKYNASVGRAIFKDVLNGSGSAADIFMKTRGKRGARR